MTCTKLPNRPTTKSQPGTPAFRSYLRKVYAWRNRIRCDLFVPDTSVPGTVLYRLRNREDLPQAIALWADHGVCKDCNRATIASGRCLDCGATYA